MVETNPIESFVRLRLVALIAAAAIILGCVEQPNVPGYSSRTADPYAAKRWSSPEFTTAHASVGDAAKHFLNIKPKPQQPIEFPHKFHTFNEIGVECEWCHSGVKKGPRAGIPGVNFCMSCHENVGDDADSRMRALRDYAKRGEDLPWQRVYGFIEESHIRFNHAPHVRAGVNCETCHGDLTQMTVAERVVNHTMGFCINCHKQKGASNECITCHF